MLLNCTTFWRCGHALRDFANYLRNVLLITILIVMEINEYAAIKLVLVGTLLLVGDISVRTGCVSVGTVV
jgi:hypothetical protein